MGAALKRQEKILPGASWLSQPLNPNGFAVSSLVDPPRLDRRRASFEASLCEAPQDEISP
jgi:hypothetical protein